MSVFENEQRFLRGIGLIEDVHERLAVLVDRVRKLPPLDAADRTESTRVQGCISRVWLVCDFDGTRCRFRVDAESTLVRGLAALICETYHDTAPADILAHDSDILESLRLTEHLTPTRRHGLHELRRTIRDFAARALLASA